MTVVQMRDPGTCSAACVHKPCGQAGCREEIEAVLPAPARHCPAPTPAGPFRFSKRASPAQPVSTGIISSFHPPCLLAADLPILSESPPENSKERITRMCLPIATRTQASLKCQMIAVSAQILISPGADFKIKSDPKNVVLVFRITFSLIYIFFYHKGTT